MDRNSPAKDSFTLAMVALRKESVDRNPLGAGLGVGVADVALRKESVDRNASKIRVVAPDICRSPQGERG